MTEYGYLVNTIIEMECGVVGSNPPPANYNRNRTVTLTLTLTLTRTLTLIAGYGIKVTGSGLVRVRVKAGLGKSHLPLRHCPSSCVLAHELGSELGQFRCG